MFPACLAAAAAVRLLRAEDVVRLASRNRLASLPAIWHR